MKSGILEHSANEKVDALCSVCGIDQFHEPLDELLFIKPLKGKRRPVSDSAHT